MTQHVYNIPGEFEILEIAASRILKKESKSFSKFLIDEKFLDEKLRPKRKFFKLDIGSSMIDVQYFKTVSLDQLPDWHPQKRSMLMISQFGLEALINLYYLKTNHQ